MTTPRTMKYMLRVGFGGEKKTGKNIITIINCFIFEFKRIISYKRNTSADGILLYRELVGIFGDDGAAGGSITVRGNSSVHFWLKTILGPGRIGSIKLNMGNFYSHPPHYRHQRFLICFFQSFFCFHFVLCICIYISKLPHRCSLFCPSNSHHSFSGLINNDLRPGRPTRLRGVQNRRRRGDSGATVVVVYYDFVVYSV